MHPRDLIRVRLGFLALTLLAALPAGPAWATLERVSVAPTAPTTCDSVMLRAAGFRPPCAEIVRAEASRPEPIPEWAGPLPAYRTRIAIRIEQSIPIVCTEVGGPYARDFPMPPLPFGQHFVTATERVFDQYGALLDSSRVDTSFVVTRSDSCGAVPCVFLGFTPPGPADDFCDASGTPGGEGCFDVDLGNTVSVGGVQLRVQITDEQGQPLPSGSFVPRSVSTTPRSSPMQTAWEADGSAANILLFASTDAVVPPGHGPVLRVCYAVGSDVPPGIYRIVFEKILVADAEGRELDLCPTFRMATGRFCVGGEQGCDVDGDGVADLRDIIRIVRCALAGAACPDTIAARADCNGDGAVDVRDVICCVRKLLLLSPRQDSAPSGGGDPTRIGFVGGAAWTSPLSGRAAIRIEPDTDFGAIAFDVAPPAGLRITSLGMDGTGAGRLEWTAIAGGGARAILLREGSAAAATATLRVGFERTGTGGLPGGALRIENVRNATWDATPGAFAVTAPSAAVSAAPIAAPAVYGARPNPFSSATEIPFAMPSAGRASLRVYDVAGRLVRTLVDGERPAGVSRAAWDGMDRSGRAAPAGIYFVKLDAAGVERTSRIMKLR